MLNRSDKNNNNYISLKVDTKPLLLFIKLFDSILQVCNRSIDASDFSFELARIESNFSSTSTNEFIITLYPSDAFLSILSTYRTGDINFSFIKESSHEIPPAK